MDKRPYIRKSLSTGTFACALILNILAAQQSRVVAADWLRTVALSGDDAPGTGPGVSIASATTVFPLGYGLVGFGGILTGPGIQSSRPELNNYAIWSESTLGLSKVVQRGDAAPGAPDGDTFGGRLILFGSRAGGAGAIWADFVGPAAKRGIWSQAADGGLVLVALSGNQAPGFSDDNIRSGGIASWTGNSRGQIAFAGQYFGPGVVGGFNYALWRRGVDGETRIVARSGDSVPGMSADFVIDGRFGDLRLSNSSRVAFTADIRQYESTDRVGAFGRLNALFGENGPDSLEVVAIQGQPAPGVDDGAVFEALASPSGAQALSPSGAIAFTAVLSGGNVDDFNARGLWTDRTGNGLTLVARAGESAPGLDADLRWFGIGGLSMNNRNEIAFNANFVQGEGGPHVGNGIWIEQYGAIRLVARTGDLLPGLQADAVFDFGWIYQSSDRAVSVIYAGLTGSPVNDSNDRGIWARSSLGDLLLVAREGDLLDVSDDSRSSDLRKISSLQLGGIDDLGCISFIANFVDGTSGAFVSSVVAVPEPDAGVLSVLSAALGFALRTARRPR